MAGAFWRKFSVVVAAFLGSALLVAGLPQMAQAEDPPLEVSIGDTSVVEGDGGKFRTLRVKFTLSRPYDDLLFVTWETRDVTATAGVDYQPRTKTTRIRAGKVQAFGAVKTIPDLEVEGDESFEVVITDVSAPDALIRRDTGTVTIIDDDPTTGTELAVGDSTVVEGNVTGLLRSVVHLTLTAPLPAPLNVTWTTVDGTATADEDYRPMSRTTTIKPGRTRVFLPAFIIQDTEVEPEEFFNIVITGVSGPTVTITRATGTTTIVDDDSPIVTGSTLWGWGNNAKGQLGVGDTTNTSDPTQVSADTDWASVTAGGSNTFAVRTDGTLWGWGDNEFGQLGLGDTTDRTSPTQVGTDTDWLTASTGNGHTLALRTDGTLWAWGSNDSGQLGLGDTTNRTSPTQVGTATTWASIATGGNHALAVRTDGTLWAWGNGGQGKLGLGDTSNRTSPTQVGTATTWATASGGNGHTLAVRTDGTLWAWGQNNNGQLGLGDTTGRTSPTQVGTDTNWASVSTGGITAGGNHSLGVRTDGTLWAWGNNGQGRLGLGDTTNRTSPTQVGTDTDWADVAAGNHSLGLRTDGTLWAWGSNGSGQLGLGDTTDRWSPTQVGTDDDWTSIGAGNGHSVALRSP
jgi:hypothetical protein